MVSCKGLIFDIDTVFGVISLAYNAQNGIFILKLGEFIKAASPHWLLKGVCLTYNNAKQEHRLFSTL